MPTPEIRVFSGLFVLRDGELIVNNFEEGESNVTQALSELEGRAVTISAWHTPSRPENPFAPGFGSCHWNGHCPCGHNEDPHLMYKAAFEGVLDTAEDGIMRVSGDPLRLEHYLTGHLGKVVIWAEGSVDPESSPDALIDEVSGLLNILTSLRDTVKEDS